LEQRSHAKTKDDASQNESDRRAHVSYDEKVRKRMACGHEDDVYRPVDQTKDVCLRMPDAPIVVTS
jgi:hypothetical protein